VTSPTRRSHLLVGGVHLGTVIAEQFDDHPLVGAQGRLAAYGEMQRSFHLVVDGVDVGSVLQKKSNHVQVAGLAGEVQRRATVDDLSASGRTERRLDASAAAAAAAAAAAVGSVVVCEFGSIVGIGSVLVA